MQGSAAAALVGPEMGLIEEEGRAAVVWREEEMGRRDERGGHRTAGLVVRVE